MDAQRPTIARASLVEDNESPTTSSPINIVPSVLMLYNMACSPAQQLEFGAFGTVQLIESSSKSINVQQNIQIDSAQSSPDKPVRQAH
ncbi:hypothetical protein U1Q18_044708 [Sarracenia purpurea var. burkii]